MSAKNFIETLSNIRRSDWDDATELFHDALTTGAIQKLIRGVVMGLAIGVTIGILIGHTLT